MPQPISWPVQKLCVRKNSDAYGPVIATFRNVGAGRALELALTTTSSSSAEPEPDITLLQSRTDGLTVMLCPAAATIVDCEGGGAAGAGAAALTMAAPPLGGAVRTSSAAAHA